MTTTLPDGTVRHDVTSGSLRRRYYIDPPQPIVARHVAMAIDCRRTLARRGMSADEYRRTVLALLDGQTVDEERWEVRAP